MANCTYNYDGKEKLTYGDVVDLLMTIVEDDPSIIIDTLFDADENEMPGNTMHHKLMEIKVNAKEGKVGNLINGANNYSTSNSKEVTLYDFLQNEVQIPDADIGSTKLDWVVNKESYLNIVRNQLRDNNEPPEEIEAKIKNLEAHWQDVHEFTSDLHHLMCYGEGDASTWNKRVDGTKFQGQPKMIERAEGRVMQAIYKNNKWNKNPDGPDTQSAHFIKNFNITSELNGDERQLFAHVDFVAINKQTGVVQLYNYKVSTESFHDWPVAKKNMHRLELAMIKQMLVSHGVPPENIRCYVIPIQVEFNDDWSQVKEINVSNDAVPLDYVNQTNRMGHEEMIAAQYIPTHIEINKIESEVLDRVTTQQKAFFSDIALNAKGIIQSVENYITNTRSYFKVKKLGEGRYEITLPETSKKISVVCSSGDVSARNQELVEFIRKEVLNELENSSHSSINFFQQHLVMSVRAANGEIGPRFTGSKAIYLTEIFKEYFEGAYTGEEHDQWSPEWEVITNEELTAAHLIIMHNIKTHQIDLIQLSEQDLNVLVKGKKGGNNLMSDFIPDLNRYGMTMKRTYGNIEAMRALLLLNEILPSLKSQNYKLGKLYVVNPTLIGKTANMYYLPNLMRDFSNCITIVNGAKGTKIENNFRKYGAEFIDPIKDLDNTLVRLMSIEDSDTLRQIHRKHFGDEKDVNEGIKIGLLNTQDFAVKKVKLKALIKELYQRAAELGIPTGNSIKLLEVAKSENTERNHIATLLIKALETLNKIEGYAQNETTDISFFEEYFIKPGEISNAELRLAHMLTSNSIDRIKKNVTDYYIDNVRPSLEAFEQEMEHSKLRDYIIGDKVRLFKRLFVYDENGHNTFIFKDPYDPNVDLLEPERKYLKKMLFEINKVRAEAHGRLDFNFKDENDPSLKTAEGRQKFSLGAYYLWAPLGFATKASRFANLRLEGQRIKKRFQRIFSSRETFIAEAEGLFSQTQSTDRDRFKDYATVYNPFLNTDTDMEARKDIIEKYGEGNFEVNVENLYLDYLSVHQRTMEYNDLLIKLNAIEAGLAINGQRCGDTKLTEHIIKLIDDFKDINIYRCGIMSENAKKWVQIMEPVRQLVSRMTIMANPVAMTRDPLTGVQNGFLNALLKFKDYRDINGSDVLYGYLTVAQKGFENLDTMSWLNQINTRFGFSNFDNADVSARLKSNRHGILNWYNILYLSVTGPDYLNRMVLFLARAHHDGVIDAYTLDSKGKLVYDWRKDKRFEVYAKGDKSDMKKYEEQRAMYRSRLRMMAEENPELGLTDESDLPDAYTFQEIRAIKKVAEDVFGAYDRNMRAKVEATAIGHYFLMYFTWMTGLTSVYWQRPQVSYTTLDCMQAENEYGEKLFLKEGSLEVTTEDTGQPFMTLNPRMVQGVVQSIGDAFKALSRGGVEQFRQEILGNPSQTNNLKRLARDLIWFALMGAFFKWVATPAYKKHKKEDDGENLVKNIFLEWIYKGGYHSTDVFAGPVNFIRYLGESTNPLPYTYTLRLLRDTWGMLVGEKAFNTTLMRETAFTRSMSDAYAMYLRDREKKYDMKKSHKKSKFDNESNRK